MSLWFCGRCGHKGPVWHECHGHGPCPMWWVPTTWVEKLLCVIGLCLRDGTCLKCDGWKQVKDMYRDQ